MVRRILRVAKPHKCYNSDCSEEGVYRSKFEFSRTSGLSIYHSTHNLEVETGEYNYACGDHISELVKEVYSTIRLLVDTVDGEIADRFLEKKNKKGAWDLQEKEFLYIKDDEISRSNKYVFNGHQWVLVVPDFMSVEEFELVRRAAV